MNGAHVKWRGMRFALQITDKIAAETTKVTKETPNQVFSLLIEILKLQQQLYTSPDQNLCSVASFLKVKGIHTQPAYTGLFRGGEDFPFSVINYGCYNHHRCTASVVKDPDIVKNLTTSCLGS